MIKFFTKKHLIASIVYLFFIIFTIVIAIFNQMFKYPTLYVSFILELFAFLIIIGTVLKARKSNALSYYEDIGNFAFKFYYIQTVINTLFILLNALLLDKWPQLLVLIQLPIIIIFFLFKKNKTQEYDYIDKKIEEEEKTVETQRIIIASINKADANSYDFSVKDKIDNLSNKIRTMALSKNKDAANIDKDINACIKELNSLLKEKSSKESIIEKISYIEALIEQRRGINRG